MCFYSLRMGFASRARLAVAGCVSFVLAGVAGPTIAASETVELLGSPVLCEIGEECFVQQMPDMKAGPDVGDPLCGQASYDGHNGWDIRLRTLPDIAREVPVLAVADGRVLRVRDGVEDRRLDRSVARRALRGTECGNGLVIAHGEALEAQYCHLKRGSVSVSAGDKVEKGQQLGAIGMSGMAEFPHLHLTVRRNGLPIDPLTGRPLDGSDVSCDRTSEGLFEAKVGEALSGGPMAVLSAGLSSSPPSLADIVPSGLPPAPTAAAQAVIGWIWVINVEKGTTFRLRLVGPDGEELAAQETEPLPRRKADYLAYAGRRMRVTPGEYRLFVTVVPPAGPPLAREAAAIIQGGK